MSVTTLQVCEDVKVKIVCMCVCAYAYLFVHLYFNGLAYLTW